ncbi:MAG: sulfite exporter TauE/SafE family protein [Firmicutes bacterium]|nr:sulfite exporter TauE/SafE family protein [Bacillota bacterium]
MKIFLYILIGLAGGVLGGLGMGGGTLLIPLLTLFTGTGQHAAQTVNLVAFIPMSAVALAIHLKNRLVKWKYLLLVSLPALPAAVGASFLAKAVVGAKLGRWFGIFLIVLGVYQLAGVAIKFFKERKEKNMKKVAAGTEV